MRLLENNSLSHSSKSISQFTYTFVRSEHIQGGKSLLDSNIKERDPIVISSESGQVALAIGYIASIRTNSVTVEVDKPLGSLNVEKSLLPGCNRNPTTQGSFLYRIDKDQLSGGSSMGRNNLINLFIDQKSAKLRELIVDARSPYFSSSKVDITDSRLNNDQVNAIGKVLSGI